jgi:hypothetical protein
VHACERSHDFEMAQFLGADIHQEILAPGVIAIQSLNGILHCGCKFAVSASELLQKHIAKTRIRFVDADRIHELLDVMIHGTPFLGVRERPAHPASRLKSARRPMFLSATCNLQKCGA